MKLVHKVSDREMDSRSRPDMNITAEAEGALQEATEMVITIMMEMSNHCAIYTKCVTMMDKDIGLVCSSMDIWHPNSWLSNVRKEGIGYALNKLPL